MAKKFGKFLLCTAAIGTAAAAAYYYFSKKDSDFSMLHEGDDDYDDFSNDLEDAADTASRNYVELSREGQSTTTDDESPADSSTSEDTDNSGFTPLASQVTQTVKENTEETIEEFFDDEDEDAEEEPLLSDME